MPSEVVRHLSVDEVLEIHTRMVEHFGGPPGIRDMGLLESALFRPQTGYYADLAEMATALFESLIMNHPFIDGNKRTAFFATDVFLRLNGYRLKVEAADAHAFFVGLLDSSTCDYEHVLPWMRQRLVPR